MTTLTVRRPTLFGLQSRLGRVRWALAGALIPRRAVRARGVAFTLQCENWITHYRWHSYDSKEPETLDWIDNVVDADGVLFDVGANIGLYSLYAGRKHPRLGVLAFEPEYANLHLLRDNVVLNGLHDRIEVYSIALGDRSGLSRLHVQDLTPGAALHTESGERLRTTETGAPVVWREGIWVTTLDEFCRKRGLWPTALKIDVDGGEARVLAGAREALGRVSSVLVEVGDEAALRSRCEAVLTDAGLRRADAHRRTASGNQLWVRR